MGSGLLGDTVLFPDQAQGTAVDSPMVWDGSPASFGLRGEKQLRAEAAADLEQKQPHLHLHSPHFPSQGCLPESPCIPNSQK